MSFNGRLMDPDYQTLRLVQRQRYYLIWIYSWRRMLIDFSIIFNYPIYILASDQSLVTVYKWRPGILLLIWKSNTRQILVSIYYISISNTCWRLRDSLPLHSCALVLGRHSWRLWRRYSRRNSTSHWSVRATYFHWLG